MTLSKAVSTVLSPFVLSFGRHHIRKDIDDVRYQEQACPRATSHTFQAITSPLLAMSIQHSV